MKRRLRMTRRMALIAAAALACGASRVTWAQTDYPSKPVRVIVAFTAGDTLIINSVGPIAVNPTLYKKLAINPLVDLVPIVQIADVPNVLVVNPSVPARTMEEFIAYAKSKPGELNYGSTGIGTSSHLSGYMLSTLSTQ